MELSKPGALCDRCFTGRLHERGVRLDECDIIIPSLDDDVEFTFTLCRQCLRDIALFLTGEEPVRLRLGSDEEGQPALIDAETGLVTGYDADDIVIPASYA